MQQTFSLNASDTNTANELVDKFTFNVYNITKCINNFLANVRKYCQVYNPRSFKTEILKGHGTKYSGEVFHGNKIGKALNYNTFRGVSLA